MANNVEVRLVGDREELFGVYQTRYEVYIEELGWTSRYADPLTRTITDNLDQSGNIFAAFRDGQVVGTLRTHHSSSADFGKYVELYEMQSEMRAHPGKLAIATMLMVRKASRMTRIAWELMLAALEKAVLDGIDRVFIECEPRMVGFYQKLGFAIHRSRIVHPEYGPGVCMSLAIQNCPLLEKLAVAGPVAGGRGEAAWPAVTS